MKTKGLTICLLIIFLGYTTAFASKLDVHTIFDVNMEKVTEIIIEKSDTAGSEILKASITDKKEIDRFYNLFKNMVVEPFYEPNLNSIDIFRVVFNADKIYVYDHSQGFIVNVMTESRYDLMTKLRYKLQEEDIKKLVTLENLLWTIKEEERIEENFRKYNYCEYTVGNNQLMTEFGARAIDLNPLVAPFIDSATQRVMVPLRSLAEMFAFDVSWDENKREVIMSIYRGGEKQNIYIKPDSLTVYAEIIKNEECIWAYNYVLSTPLQIINDRTFVPIRFIVELLHYKVDWDESRQSVYINFRYDFDNIEAFLNIELENGVLSFNAVTFNLNEVPVFTQSPTWEQYSPRVYTSEGVYIGNINQLENYGSYSALTFIPNRPTKFYAKFLAKNLKDGLYYFDTNFASWSYVCRKFFEISNGKLILE